MANIQNIANWLIDYRRSNNLSIRELGRQSGIPHTTLAEIEKGLKPSLNVVKKLAAFAGVEEEYLFKLSNFLKEKETSSPTLEAITYEANTLPLGDQEEVLEFIRLKHKLLKKKNK